MLTESSIEMVEQSTTIFGALPPPESTPFLPK